MNEARDISVLVVEDDNLARRYIATALEKAGFKPTEVASGEEALSIAKSIKPDAIVLDVMLPGMDGFETCTKLQESDIDSVIVMLTAKSEDLDKIRGLEIGADDYMVKPFNPDELVARIKAILRRWRPNEPNETMESMGITVDYKAAKIYKDTRELDLTPREFAILNAFMQNQGKLLSRETLYGNVWGENHFGGRKAIDVYIKRLREKIEDDPSNPQLIKTVWGKGYVFGDLNKI
ncbi:MAG: response regulator transcription factor [Holophagales bacterium]|nr:response regulator transcription factor [Holophagales bacterium]